MEPARGERDDGANVQQFLNNPVPQWSPLVVSGMTVHEDALNLPLHWPQWSPLVVSGMTGDGQLARRPRLPGRNGARSW